MMNKVDEFGNKITIARTSKQDAFWFRLSHFADHSIIWFVLGAIRFCFTRNWQDLLRFACVMAAESAITNGPIKFIFRKKRPHEETGEFKDEEKLPYGMRRPITSSFPSGHATAAMCAATLLSSGFPLIAVLVFPLGLMVAYSRMYTRMHHLSDILAGLALGLIFGYLAVTFIPV